MTNRERAEKIIDGDGAVYFSRVERRDLIDAIASALDDATAEEREACAGVANDWGVHPQPELAKAIRARGKENR